MAEKLNIRLKIAGKSFPMEIDWEQEEFYRRAERELNELVATFKSRFRAGDEDYLAMAALQLAVKNVMEERKRSRNEEEEQLIALNQELEQYIKEVL